MRLLSLFCFTTLLLPLSAQWSTVGQNAQHTALSAIGAQPLNNIKWQTEVDQGLAGTSGDILVHYGAPIVTPANTVFVPVRTATPSYQIEVHNGATGAIKWTLNTDWTPPSSTWVPSYAPGLSARNRFYYAGAGGTVYYLDSPDTNSTPTQLAFYGESNYLAHSAAFNSSVMISTPIVSDRYGDIFFGFIVTGSSNPGGLGLTSGIARISYTGAGSWVGAATAANLTVAEQTNLSVSQVPINCAPALSNDSTTLYFGTNNNGGSGGYLVAISASTLAPVAHVLLTDPNTLKNATVLDISTSSPVVGPDGDVYYGVFETSCCSNHDRGWMLHFNGIGAASPQLSVSKIPGAFGWDDTPSIVPYSLVPSYTGHSSYLIFSKYNNYIDTGGDGENKVAILDPTATEIDPVTGVAVMQEVITILGPTPNGAGGVREWCINSAAIDKVHKSAIVNSEDGVLYWWDFTSNTLTQRKTLTAGVGEAYTPTVIGPDGTAYAINDGYLFAVGQ